MKNAHLQTVTFRMLQVVIQMGSILLPMVYVGMHLSWKINFQCLQLYIAGIKPAIDVGFSSIGLGLQLYLLVFLLDHTYTIKLTVSLPSHINPRFLEVANYSSCNTNPTLKNDCQCFTISKMLECISLQQLSIKWTKAMVKVEENYSSTLWF